MTVELLSGANDQEKIQQLIENLVGKGINLIDYEVKGDLNQQFGLFAAGEDLYLPSAGFAGTIFSTGNVLEATGPNDSDSITGSLGQAGDEDLSNIIEGDVTNTNDAAVLEFTFTVKNPSVFNFSYLFASDEYNEFVNSSFNDVFAFFFKQIGVIGEDGEPVYDNPIPPNTIDNNIATLSIQTTDENGSTVFQNIPVAINNLNGTTTVLLADGNPVSSLYNNNDLSDIPAEDLKNIQYDGFSNILSANTDELTPGNIYSFKIAIADVGDSAYDSGVFIGSLSADVLFAQDDFISTPVDNSLDVKVLDNDTLPTKNFKGITKIDGQTIPDSGVVTLDSGSTVTLNDNGTAELTDDSLVYEAAPMFYGTDSFTYNIQGAGNQDSALVTLNVGNVIIDPNKNRKNEIIGTDGRDIIFGLGGHDTIDGGAGNDRINGGYAQRHQFDVLTGGEGIDTFVLGERTAEGEALVNNEDGRLNKWDNSYATITDFEQGVDKLELAGILTDYTVMGSNLYYDFNDDGIWNNTDDLLAKFSNGVEIDLATDAMFI